ncbi:hypothetical protein F2Q69_00023795 [Brassica cretica]|uniref:Uncharacterized protein n=1 Tax=Brassica cretica TaxID=69181 RepID=A0A8S9Q5B5_BRACR|nr:hypothetical protein F2Q69_00023795 [Brassica cretica]
MALPTHCRRARLRLTTAKLIPYTTVKPLSSFLTPPPSTAVTTKPSRLSLLSFDVGDDDGITMALPTHCRRARFRLTTPKLIPYTTVKFVSGLSILSAHLCLKLQDFLFIDHSPPTIDSN